MADSSARRSEPVQDRDSDPGWRSAAAIWLALGLFAAATTARAESFVEHFSSPNPSWVVNAKDQTARTITHRRSPEHGSEGAGEQLTVETDRDGATIRIEHVLPKARVLNELEMTVRIRCETPGLKAFLRVLLPEYEDDAGRPLSMPLPGDVSEEGGDWQTLTCRTDDETVRDLLVRMRAKHRRTLTPKIMVVDRVILTWPLEPGVNELALDELTLDPLVRVDEDRAAETVVDPELSDLPPVQFRLGRFEIEGRPSFPRIVQHHGEPLKDLASAGFNVVWMDDHTDKALLKSARDAGMWVAATPPVPHGAPGDAELQGEAGLLPFGDETRSIAMWMMGTRISPQSQHRLVKWVDQVQEADRKFRRPIAGDISGEERIFSSELDLLGLSRHTIGSSLRLADYRDWLVARRNRARPGSWCWTWIQVAPTPAVSAIWEEHQIPLQLEPEQIRLQVYAALSAGVRGLGFWTQRPLNDDTDADRETLLALRQINWELWLMEPWLATASAAPPIPVTIETGRPAKKKKAVESRIRFKRKRNNQDPALDPLNESDESDLPPPLISAAVLRTDYGTLLLPMWLEEQAQFVPGQLAASTISLVVPGVPETAVAWEITTTGIHSLPRERQNSGVKVTLKNFDQTACILLTTDRDVIDQVRQRVAEIEEQSARTCLALAELKLERTRQIDQRLGEAGLRQAEGPQYLGEARKAYMDGRAALSSEDWQRVRLKSREAMQMARVLQREHWDDAVRQMSSPVASPFTIAFQSLPAQARLAMQMADDSAGAAPNLLPTGNFEEVHLTAVGWKHQQHAPDTLHAEAELNPDPHRGKYCLRLKARPTPMQTPALIPAGRELVSMTTPPVTVHAGHAVRIAGWIKIPAEISGTQDGVMIYDTLHGRNLALRFREPCGWERFELVREVTESQDVTVTISLTGLGEVSLDDLEISVHPVSPIARTSAREASTRPRAAAPDAAWPDLKRRAPMPNRGVPRRAAP